MKVLLVKPGKYAEEAEIGNRLDVYQKIVGGHIETYSPNNDPVVYVMNEEGKIAVLELNRALYDHTGKIVDIVAGNFFVCGVKDGNFVSLSPELMAKYKEQFLEPETFVLMNGRINAVKSKQSVFEKIKEGAKQAEKQNDNRSSSARKVEKNRG